MERLVILKNQMTELIECGIGNAEFERPATRLVFLDKPGQFNILLPELCKYFYRP